MEILSINMVDMEIVHSHDLIEISKYQLLTNIMIPIFQNSATMATDFYKPLQLQAMASNLKSQIREKLNTIIHLS